MVPPNVVIGLLLQGVATDFPSATPLNFTVSYENLCRGTLL